MKRKLLTATVSIVALAFMVSIASYAKAAEKEMLPT